MASSKTFSILEYIVLGLPKKIFRSIRAWQHPSTSADISTQGLGENFAICRFLTYKHHNELPVNGGILIYVSHLVLWRPSWGALPGGQREGGRGEAQHDHGEHHQYYLWHHFQNASAQVRQIRIYEDHYQVIRERGDKGELIMTMENTINYTCCTIIKMSAHSKGRITFMRTQSGSTGGTISWGSPTRP